MASLSNLFVELSLFEETGKKIGSGAFGDVFVVIEKRTGKEYAAKLTKITKEVKQGKNQENMMREVIILKTVHHPAILEYRGFNMYDFQKSPRPTILTELMERGPLDKMINLENKKMAPADWNSTKKQIILIGVASAMRYLHRRNIIHRDLKPANILLDANLYPRVCDFGLSKALESEGGTSQTMNLGTPLFMAPELFADNNMTYGTSVDVYAFGILMHQLVTGISPYADFVKGKRMTAFLLISHVSKGGRPSFANTNVSSEFQKFINDCWAPNPADRMDFEQIVEELTNNREFVIDDTVDVEEVAAYVEKIEEIEETKEGKTMLSFCQNPISFEVKYSTKSSEEKLPMDFKKKEMMFQDIKNRGFLVQSKEATLQLLIEFAKEITKDYKFFASVIDFANMNNQQGNQTAKKLLDTIFKEYIVSEKVSEIEKGMFKERNFSRVNIPPKVLKIGNNAFNLCTSLSFINIPPTVEKLGSAIFKGCRTLEFINLNSEIKEIPTDAFKDCTSLAFVILPKGLTRICRRAFENCVKLQEIDIPASVTLIENAAFKGCKNLNNARIHSKSTKYEKSAFGAWKRPKIVL